MLCPQTFRTFFITTCCWRKRTLFQMDRNCELLIDVLTSYRDQGRFLLHEFVIMPDHLHAILTPAYEVPLEKTVQFIKGGFSFRIKRELGFNGEVWQAGFTNYRIKVAADYETHRNYILNNPIRAGLGEHYRWISSRGVIRLDAPPPGLKPHQLTEQCSPA